MKKKLLLALLCITVYGLNAQVYIDQSHTYGSTAADQLDNVVFQGDYAYSIVRTFNKNYPVTNTTQNPSTLNTQTVVFHTIYQKVHKSTGAVVASSYIAPWLRNPTLKVGDGKVYVVGRTFYDYTHPSKQNSPPSNSTTYLYLEVDENTGDLLYGKYFGGTGTHGQSQMDMSDDYIVFGDYTRAPDLPVTDTTSNVDGDSRLGLFVLDKASRNLIYCSYFEGGDGQPNQRYELSEYILDGNKLYVLGNITDLEHYTVVNDVNNFSQTPGQDVTFLARLDLTTYTWDYRTHFMNGFNIDCPFHINETVESDNDYLYMVGMIPQDASPAYTAINGTSLHSPSSSAADVLYLKVDKNTGGIVTSGIVGGSGIDEARNMHIDGNLVFISGRTLSDDLFANDGSSRTPTNPNSYDGFYAELDKNTSNIIKEGYLGLTNSLLDIRLTSDNNFLHLSGVADELETIGGQGTQDSREREVFYIKKSKSSGKTLFAGFLGGTAGNQSPPRTIHLDSGYVYISGTVPNDATDYPITTAGLPSSYGSSDFYYTRLASCDITTSFPADTLSPASQTVCEFGYAPPIDGPTLIIPSDSFPLIYRNFTPEPQVDFEASYQWQESGSAAGPWSNISTGVLEDYIPTVGSITKYYRRLAYIKSCGENNLVSTSSVAAVNVNSNNAPTADAGGFAYSCPGTTVTLGGAPSATGGTSPYTYQWFRGSETIPFDSVANPVTSAQNSSIYTLWVTDANGCTQLNQTALNVVNVDAGPDIGSCDGDSAIIQAQGVAGLSGTTYSWLPTTGLDCATCLQPTALVNGLVNYELRMTIPKTGGGTCTVVDTMQVIPTTGPLNPNFAGPDKVVCFYGTTDIGIPAETVEAPIVAVSQRTTAAGGTGTVVNIADSSFATGAVTNNASGQWVAFDLGEERNIISLDVSSITANSLDNVRLQVSTDNTNWTTISTDMGTVSNTSLTNYALPSITSARYIRFRYGNTRAMTVSELHVNAAKYKYTWAPGDYLSSNDRSLVTYDPGNLSFPPTPNPATYYVTAEANGCVYYDTTVVSVIRAEAGGIACGPRQLGNNTDVPGLNEQFIWTKISGDGNFIGPTNVPYPEVTATTTGSTFYQLQTVYNGDTCTDQVEVPVCGCDLGVVIGGGLGCPNANLGPVILIASSDVFGSNVIWDWSPKVGLSNYNTAIVELTDLTTRTYTVTVRSSIDTTQFCSDTILVNAPNMNTPVFSAVDTTICAGDSIQIGAPNVAGYSYSWSPADNLSDPAISDPIANNVMNSTDYIVEVEDVGSGCILRDTASIQVVNILANAKPDWFVCQNAQIVLGAPPIAGRSYAWTPQAAWQNGTDSSSAQPEPLIATSTDFYLTVTDSLSGCKATDTASVVVNNNPSLPDYPDAILCEGNSVFIGGDTPLPGVTYSWTPTTGLVSPNELRTEVVGITSNQSYVLSATYPGNCPTATDLVSVTVDNFSISLSDTTYCPSGGAFSLGSGVPQGLSYRWSPANLVTALASSNPSTLNPPPANETTFMLIARNSNGCVDTASRKITPAGGIVSAGSDKSICINETTTLGSTSNATGTGITYVWSPTTDLSCTSCVNPTFTPSAAGTFTYTLTRTDGSGCIVTDEVSITVDDLPVGALSQPVICQNASVQIGTTPSVGVTYIWSPTAGLSDSTIANPIASPTTTTVYTLTAVGGNGCVAQEPVAVTVNPTPAPTVDAQTVTICQSSGGGVMNASVSPAGNYSYLWTPSTGLSSATVLNPSFVAGNIGSTIYTLTVTDGTTGCTGSDTTLITIDDCLASIGNYVWYDVNKDGIQDNNETGVLGVRVYLVNAIGQVLDSTVTSSTGYYSFTGLTPSTYGIQFNLSTLPSGYEVTAQDAGTDDALDSDGSPINGYAGSATLVENENNTSFDLGIHIKTPVPVVLTDFVLTETGCNAQLDWTTASEQHTSHFNVMRSANSGPFKKIGEVAAAGNSDVELHYGYGDEDLEGFYLYKLDIVDIDGQISQSETKGLLINCATMGQIKLYPNPVNDNLQVLSQLEHEDYYFVKLYDLTGRVIYETKREVEEGKDTFEIPMRSLASGSYFLVINGETIGKKEFKVLKQ